MDYLYQNEAQIRLSIFLSAFVILALVEWLLPKRNLVYSKAKRWVANFSLIVVSTIVLRLLVPTAAVGAAVIAEQNGLGIANYYDMPFWLVAVSTFILLDLTVYVQHVLFHVMPVLWRFHRVHHSDVDCDVSTGLRFHPVEILLSIGIKLTAILVLGAPVLTVVIFEAVLNMMSMFTHSNIRLNRYLEKLLRLVLVTPDMHRIHHSAQENETNSNFAFHISLWDRIFGTYIAEPKLGQKGMMVGLDQFREANWQSLPGLLYMPFSSHIGGYAINYRDTKNEEELAYAKKIAEQAEDKAKLASELEVYINAIDQHALVSVTDAQGRIIQVNKKFSEVSGYREEELIGKNHNVVNSHFHPREFFTDMWKIIASGQKWHGEICNKAKDGSLYWVDSTILPMLDSEGRVARYYSVRIDITDRKKQEEQIQRAFQEVADANKRLERISRVDALTGVANRRHFDEVLYTEFSKMGRSMLPLTLILCDIDYFKKYNDSYGHQAGDDCLKQVAQSISASFFRVGDFVARFGGEEFAVVLSDVDPEGAINVAERMRRNLEELNIEHRSTKVANMNTVTISVGVTTMIPSKSDELVEIIRRADRALYKAKELGRNCIQFCDGSEFSSFRGKKAG